MNYYYYYKLYLLISLTLLVYVVVSSAAPPRVIRRQPNRPKPTRVRTTPRPAANIQKSLCSSAAKLSRGARSMPHLPSNHGGYYRLSEVVTPDRYKLRFRLDPARRKLYGHVLVKINIREQTNLIEMNSIGLTLIAAAFRTNNIRVDAHTVYYCPEKETIILHFPKYLHRGTANLTITFQGNLTEMTQLGLVKHLQNGVILTDLGPLDARRLFPCWDEPKFRAQFDLYLIVPRNSASYSNLGLSRKRAYSPELEEIRFETTPIMSTYQLTALIGPKWHITSGSNLTEVPIHLLSTDFRSDFRSQWDFALDTAEMLLIYFHYYFDSIYPLKQLNLVALDHYEQTSIEKMGLVFFAKDQLSVPNQTLATEEELQPIAETLAHSLSHQWLGNLVAISDWSQFYLFEGLNNFMEHEALDSLFPHWKTWQKFTADQMSLALRLDSSHSAQALTQTIKHPHNISLSYTNENLYLKTTLLMRMLKATIGDECFQKSIRRFVKKYSNLTATEQNLWQSFTEAIDQQGSMDLEIKEYHKQVVLVVANWTQMAGFPVLHVKERQQGESRILKIRQERFFELRDNLTSSSKELWTIPVSVINSFNPFSASHQALMTDEEVEIAINEIWDGEWVKVNPAFGNFYRVHYSTDMLDKFTISIEEKLLPSLDRLNLVDDLFAMVRAGYQSTDVGLKFLFSYENEDNPNVWSVIQSALMDLDLILSQGPNDEQLRRQYWQFGENLLSRLYNRIWWYTDTSLPPVGQKMRLEDFAQAQLRQKVLCAMGRFHGSNFTQEAKRKYLDYLNGVSDLPLALLECVFRAYDSFLNDNQGQAMANHKNSNHSSQFGVQHLEQLYREYAVEENRHLLSLALGSLDKPKDIDRVVAFALQPIVSPRDAFTIFKELCQRNWQGRQRVLGLLTNPSKLREVALKFGSVISMFELIKMIVESHSNLAHLAELQHQLRSQPHLSHLHNPLRDSFEKVSIHQRWLERDRHILTTFFTQLNDLNDSLHNGTVNVIEVPDNFFELDDEFFVNDDKRKRKKRRIKRKLSQK